jgi:hypothetical protein
MGDNKSSSIISSSQKLRRGSAVSLVGFPTDWDDISKCMYPYVLRIALWKDNLGDAKACGTPIPAKASVLPLSPKKVSRANSLDSTQASPLLASEGGGILAGPLTYHVRTLFGLPPGDKSMDPSYKQVKQRCADKHLFRDLQHYGHLIERDKIYEPRDFMKPTLYLQWKLMELRWIRESCVEITSRDLKSAKKSKLSGPNLMDACSFIPSRETVQLWYFQLLQKCHDYDMVHATVDNEWQWPWIGSLTHQLLTLVAQRWRVHPFLEQACRLDLALHYVFHPKRPQLREKEIRELTHLITQFRDTHSDLLPTQQLRYIRRLLVYVGETLGARIQHPTSHFVRAEFLESVEATAIAVCHCHDVLVQGTWAPEPLETDEGAHELAQCVPNLTHSLRTAAYRHFIYLTEKNTLNSGKVTESDTSIPATEVQIHPQDTSTDLEGTLLLLDAVYKEVYLKSSGATRSSSHRNVLCRSMVEFAFNHLEQTGLASENQQIFKVFRLYNLITELANFLEQKETDSSHGTPSTSLGSISVLAGAGSAMAPTVRFNRSSIMKRYQMWFHLSVDNWIERMSHTMTQIWAKRMVAGDSFEAHVNSTYSSSVIDLFSAFHQEVDAITSLPWPSFDHEYRAKKKFAKMICSTLLGYADVLQSQLIGILLQLEEDDPDVERDEVQVKSYQTHETKLGIMQRIRRSIESKLDRDRDRSVAGKVIRKLRAPVPFSPAMCVRLNNIYAAKIRMDRLYHHMILAISSEVEDEYVSPFVNDESLIAFQILNLESERSSQDMFSVEVCFSGNSIGRTNPCIPKLKNEKSLGKALPKLNIARSMLIPGNDTVSVQLTIYQHARLEETQLSSPSTERGKSGSGQKSFPIDEKVVGSATLKLKLKSFSPNGHWHEVDTAASIGRLKIHFQWCRAESYCVHYWFNETFRKLSMMTDNVLLMMAHHIGLWMQDYFLHLVKQYKVRSAIMKSNSSFTGNETGNPRVQTRGAGKRDISFANVEQDMEPLLDYLNKSLEVLNQALDERVTAKLFKQVWTRTLLALEWQLTCRRDKSTGRWKSLDVAQVTLLRRALTLLYDFFAADGDGLPLKTLQSSVYHRIQAILTLYLESSDDLMQHYLSALNFHLAVRIERMHRRARSMTKSPSSSTMLNLLGSFFDAHAALERSVGVGTSPLSILNENSTLSHRHTLTRKKRNEMEQQLPPVVQASQARSTDGRLHLTTWNEDSDESSDDESLDVADQEHRRATLARQDAVWTLLSLRAENETDVADFLGSQNLTVRRILSNVAKEVRDQHQLGDASEATLSSARIHSRSKTTPDSKFLSKLKLDLEAKANPQQRPTVPHRISSALGRPRPVGGLVQDSLSAPPTPPLIPPRRNRNRSSVTGTPPQSASLSVPKNACSSSPSPPLC